MFERTKDEAKGLHILVELRNAVIDQNLSGNPSARRDGLRVQFRCEGCLATPVLTIAQHKGQTHVMFASEQ